MAKRTNTLKLTEFRNLLVENCNRLIDQYMVIIGKVQQSDAFALFYERYYTKTGKASRRTGTSTSAQPHPQDAKVESELLVPAHAGLIREWHIFLDSVFARVVLHYLKTDVPEKLPKTRIILKKIKPTNIVNTLESISEAAKESFSFEKYDSRITTLRSIFGIKHKQLEDDEIKKQVKMLNDEMKKHVNIRNAFQHHRGEVRDSDLEGISLNYFELLNDNGDKTKFYRGQDIILSWPEIENLNQIIKDYSEKFEELS